MSNIAGNVTSTSATLTVNVMPSITTQPVSTTVTAPNQATFTVVATGTAPLSYQWRRNGANISGATNASYVLNPTAGTDNGALFSVVVTNVGGAVTSANATLTVNVGPASPRSPQTSPSLFRGGELLCGRDRDRAAELSVAAKWHQHRRRDQASYVLNPTACPTTARSSASSSRTWAG